MIELERSGLEHAYSMRCFRRPECLYTIVLLPFWYNGCAFAWLAEGAWSEPREGLSFSRLCWYSITLLSPGHES
jgi:hypothetical protein